MKTYSSTTPTQPTETEQLRLTLNCTTKGWFDRLEAGRALVAAGVATEADQNIIAICSRNLSALGSWR